MTLAAGRHDDELRSPMSAYAKAAIAAVAGVAIGLTATYLATSGVYPFGAVSSGPWTIWPLAGSLDIDPYARAIIARQAELPLGNGEGLSFLARVDDSGEPLEGSCEYTIAGQTPPARLWTLTLYDPAGKFIDAPGRHTVTSADVLRMGSGPTTIVVAPNARAGNWLAGPRGARFVLAFNLYDTSVSPTHAAIEGLSLFSIRRGDCL